MKFQLKPFSATFPNNPSISYSITARPRHLHDVDFLRTFHIITVKVEVSVTRYGKTLTDNWIVQAKAHVFPPSYTPLIEMEQIDGRIVYLELADSKPAMSQIEVYADLLTGQLDREHDRQIEENKRLADIARAAEFISQKMLVEEGPGANRARRIAAQQQTATVYTGGL